MATKTHLLLVLSVLVPLSAIRAQGTDVRGTVRDRVTGDPLPSANVVIGGTSLGAATNSDGEYVIRNVPPGVFTLRVSYLGYQPVTLEIDIAAGNVYDVVLVPATLEGEEVVITAQAKGQQEAINQQLASDRIVNVVSSARIQELPDANAAESVGRLPGVSVIRVGGEGTQVVVRGLEPKYNVITVNGVRMSSSNSGDRSADLSMISPYMIEAIEVTKTPTPDQDADVLGGTIDFRLREAGAGREGLGVSLMAQVAYNGLSNAPNKLNNYKYVAGAEGRFLDDALGLFVQADLERRNLTSNEMGGTYTPYGNSLVEYLPQSVLLNHVPRDRQRVNGTIVMDYRLPEGRISLSNFASKGVTNTENREESFSVQTNRRDYRLVHSKRTLNTISNTIEAEHSFFLFDARITAAHAYSESDDPDMWSVGFQLVPAGLDQFLNRPNLFPESIVQAAASDPQGTILGSLVTSSGYAKERAFVASLDLKTEFSLGDNLKALIKFGGKHRRQDRFYDYAQSGSQGLALVSARLVDSLIASHFPSTAQYVNTTQIPIAPFVDPGFDYGTFLENKYSMGLPLNFAMLAEMVRYIKSMEGYLSQRGDVAYFHDQFASKTRDYTGREDQSAFYLMATVTVGQDLTIIPGVRYQNLRTQYTAARGHQNTSSSQGGRYEHYDTTATMDHPYWLPAVLVRYKPLPWFDIRLSHTNTLAYPDYIGIIPRIDVAIGTAIEWNNFRLVPSRSRNYDAYVSFYENTIGLFTVGGFLKQIDDLIYPWTFYVSGAKALEYYPPSQVLTAPNPNATYSVASFFNNPFRIDNWGVELDWQTHFWYFPRPLDGLVLNVNYTHIFSRAEYPYTYRVPGRQIIYVDTSYIDRLLRQPNDIVNLSLGYDYGGLSVRISMLYQSDIFTGTNFWPQVRSSTAPYTRWDLSVKQELPWFGLELYGDVSNLNGVSDISTIHAPTGVPRSMQSYGFTADIGIRWRY